MRIFLLFTLAILLVSCSDPVPENSLEKIGLKRFEYVDNSRQNWAEDGPRPMTTYVWYPVANTAKMTEITIPPSKPIFIGGFAARNVPLRKGVSKRPLIVMSHGTGGAGMQMMWLGRRLAATGYIAVAVDHHGDTAAEATYDPRGFRLFWERPKDISRVIDQILNEPDFAEAIDPDRIAVVGFSLGGYTVIALAGGRVDLGQFKKFCASPKRDTTCDPQPEFPNAAQELDKLRASDKRIDIAFQHSGDSFRDPRISMVVALAPALGSAFTMKSLGKITIPVHIIVGGADTTAPPETNGRLLADSITNARFDIINQNATHYIFLNICTFRGRMFVPPCKDPDGVNRIKIHNETASLILNDLRHQFGPVGLK